MKISMFFSSLPISLALGLAPISSTAQMLKDIVDAAPNEDPAPMPHIVPGDPSKMNVKQDEVYQYMARSA